MFTSVTGLNFLQHVRANPEGYAHFTLSGDYYNRELSGKYKIYPCIYYYCRIWKAVLHTLVVWTSLNIKCM